MCGLKHRYARASERKACLKVGWLGSQVEEAQQRAAEERQKREGERSVEESSLIQSRLTCHFALYVFFPARTRVCGMSRLLNSTLNIN